jgi:7-carboxy-7-deazaguanine synthase
VTGRPVTASGATLVVNQVFGAWQGEGPSAGQRATFIRLMGCNLACDWTPAGGGPCDEAQTWDASRFNLAAQGTRWTPEALASRCEHGLVVITGGEPLLHQAQPGWAALLSLLLANGVRAEVETNGTLVPDPDTVARVSGFNVSPKLASSGMPLKRRIVAAALLALRDSGKAIFKFVCTSPSDVDEVDELTRYASIAPRLVWIMPEGVAAGPLLARARILAPAVASYGFNLTLRQHILLYLEGEPR